MLDAHQIEELIRRVSAMERETLVRECLAFPGAFPVDFTPDFLAEMPLDRLRHIFVALCLHHKRMPPAAVETAA